MIKNATNKDTRSLERSVRPRSNGTRKENPPKRQTPRERLLASATHLFCKNGINATGVDAIVAAAGTAKTTLYKEFGSKESLVHIVLETEGKQWRDWFLEAVERGGGDAKTRLIRIFAVLKQWFRQDSFFGCPFINAISEHDKSDKALRAITLKHKRVVLAYVESLADEIGALRPEDFAHQIALLMDGAIVAAMVTGDARTADTAGHAARMLIEKLPVRAKRKPLASRKLEFA